jgi:hypothetical protein
MDVEEGKGDGHNLISKLGAASLFFFLFSREIVLSVYGFCHSYDQTTEWTSGDENRMVVVN